MICYFAASVSVSKNGISNMSSDFSYHQKDNQKHETDNEQDSETISQISSNLIDMTLVSKILEILYFIVNFIHYFFFLYIITVKYLSPVCQGEKLEKK